MEEELIGAVPCSSLAVDSILRVGTVFPKLIYFDLALLSYSSGLVAGVFTATCCGIQRYRRQNDWVNPLIAGAVAGATVAAGTRSWTQVVGMAGLVSAFSVAADYSKTF
ncbi:hypothetical protein OIU78_015292 [Salix suchowensis]|nr:hypothetical protein OIU78_015292 [Salix suchowensis]